LIAPRVRALALPWVSRSAPGRPAPPPPPPTPARRRIPTSTSPTCAEVSGAARPRALAGGAPDGAYVDDAAGVVQARGRLPLGTSGDDVEGLALDGDRVWGLTSSGQLLAWQRGDQGYTLVDGGALDAICGPTTVNCGANYEGLCLAPTPLADGCDGYAASKANGTLVCLRRDGRGWALAGDRAYPVSDQGKLADCAIAADGTVWTGDNGFGLGAVRQWAIGADGPTLVGQARLGMGFPEVLAFGPDHTLYRFSDLGGAPSLAVAFRCPARLPKAGPADGAE
jgi:hypothetical protein